MVVFTEIHLWKCAPSMTITLILFWKNFQKKLIKKFFLFGDFNKDPADKDLWFAQHNYYIRSSVLSDMICLDVKIPQYFDSVILNYTCRFAIIPLNLIHQLSQSSSNLVPSVQFLQYCFCLYSFWASFLSDDLSLSPHILHFSDTSWKR